MDAQRLSQTEINDHHQLHSSHFHMSLPAAFYALYADGDSTDDSVGPISRRAAGHGALHTRDDVKQLTK
jgi:hypothetical protein